VQSPCDPLIEDYTEIFHIIDGKDILAIQYKMSLRGPKSVRKVDSLNLIFIDFYVTAHTPHLNTSEISLQLSENTTLLAVYRIYTNVINKET
jgi:hypothetical protein